MDNYFGEKEIRINLQACLSSKKFTFETVSDGDLQKGTYFVSETLFSCLIWYFNN